MGQVLDMGLARAQRLSETDSHSYKIWHHQLSDFRVREILLVNEVDDASSLALEIHGRRALWGVLSGMLEGAGLRMASDVIAAMGT